MPEFLQGCDAIVHIAAWHGIHEDSGEKAAYDFFDLNVRGTFEVFAAAASLGISKMVYISTTSIRRPDTLYGRSKLLAEQIVEDTWQFHNMNVVTLRPRGFIPFWNHTASITTTSNGLGGSGAAPCISMTLQQRWSKVWI